MPNIPVIAILDTNSDPDGRSFSRCRATTTPPAPLQLYCDPWPTSASRRPAAGQAAMGDLGAREAGARARAARKPAAAAPAEGEVVPEVAATLAVDKPKVKVEKRPNLR